MTDRAGVADGPHVRRRASPDRLENDARLAVDLRPDEIAARSADAVGRPAELPAQRGAVVTDEPDVVRRRAPDPRDRRGPLLEQPSDATIALGGRDNLIARSKVSVR